MTFERARLDDGRPILITGGCGFIGCNLAASLAGENVPVRVLDNLVREGARENARWLMQRGGVEIRQGDVRDAETVRRAVAGASAVLHLAGQVAVTTSLDDPIDDFEVNARGTLNVLEAARLSGKQPFVFYTSTNKVYGALNSVEVVAGGESYRTKDRAFRGVNESQRLDFHSPYGCSKGTADQYVRDYARIYKLPTVVFRMSCIAGPRQFGTEDQGWVAHFLYSAIAGRLITIYGDGLQVRDVLHVYDLIDAIHAARKHIDQTAGRIYNLGGGLERAYSVLQMLRAIERSTGVNVRTRFDQFRPGDQPLYISDTASIESDTGWRARRTLRDILTDIHAFAMENHAEGIAAQKAAVPAIGALEGAA